MNKKKLFAVVISLALVIAVVLPGTLAVSTDQTSSNGTIEVPTETTTPAPDTTETPVPEGTEAPAETPTEEPVKTCTCDLTPADGEAHLEGCPLYVKPTEENPFKELYDKLMAAASMVEFTEICAAYTDDDIAQFEKWVVENELLDSLQSHIYAISPAPTMPETVVFTDAGPFMPPVDVADSGSGN